jgi:predicted alpha/beta-hydrolase family hydrolase
MQHPFMAGVADGLAAGGVTTLRFNFPYMESRRGAPDAAPVLLRTWEAALEHAADRGRGLPIIAGGKSLGGRMASMLAAAQEAEFAGRALVFFGYPLHAPGRTDQLRDAHLARIRVPMLFIQGSRDALARLDLIESLVGRLPLARLYVVTGGDHSFRIPGVKGSGNDTGRALAQIAVAFIKEIIERPNRRHDHRK